MRRPIMSAVAGIVFAAGASLSARAQANLDAGKTPAQIFAQGCSTCHRSAQELAPVGRDFLIEHYTTGYRQADAMSAYLQAVRLERAAKPRRSPTAEVVLPEVASTGSINADALATPKLEEGKSAADAKPEAASPAPVPELPQFEE
jgi:hypothetical protein